MKRTLLMAAALGYFIFAQIAQADWTPVRRLTWTLSSSTDPAIAIDSMQRIHIVYRDNPAGKDEIYYKISPDGGATWSAAKRLTWTSSWSYYPDIAIDSSDTVHIVWQDHTPGNFEIYYKKSTNGGATWSAAKRLSWTSGWSESAAIATDSSGAIHVVWDDDTSGSGEIFYRRSSDGGATWTAATKWTSGSSLRPALAIGSSDTIHVVWHEGTPGMYEIFYRKSDDGGTTWSAIKRLTWTPGFSQWSAVAIDPGAAIHVVWQDDTPGNSEVYYTRSTDGGTTWDTAQRLTWTSNEPSYPSLAMAIDSGGGIHVVWNDYTPGNFEIYYKSSADGGTTWAPSKRLTWNGGVSDHPAIAIDSINRIHVLWEDETPGNYEIYYRKGQ